MLNTYTLKNGIKVATYSIPQMRSAFLAISVKGGSIFDDEKNSGVAHFMEHILCEGIPSFPDVEVLSDFIENIAGSYNASTGIQTVRFNINAPVTYLDDLVKISSEVFFEPLFPESSMERERSAILEEIRLRADDLGNKNYRFSTKVRYKEGHPLLLDGGGSEESVKSLKREDLINYWKKFFLPKNTYLVIVGGFKNDTARKVIEKYFDKYDLKKEFAGFPKLTNKDMNGRTTAIRFDQDLRTCYVSISFPSISDAFPIKSHLTQSLIHSVLGGLRRSRLYRLLRQRKGLVYDAGSGASTFNDFGIAYLYAQVGEENIEQVLELMAKEMKVFVENGPTQEELDFAKNYRINRTLMQFDHPSSIASWIESDLVWEDKIYTPEEVVDIYNNITIEDINKFLKENWDLSKLNLVIQGPVKNSKENIKKYSKLVEDLK